jgi:hypothetical protein
MKHSFQSTAIDILDEVKNCMEFVDPRDFVKPLPVLDGNSIGRHIRHILEFFQCLDLAVETGYLNYDLRARNLQMETDPEFTRNQIEVLKHRIAFYSNVEIEMEVDYGQGVSRIQTTVFRELVYNIEHSVHHLAILKIGIQSSFPQVEIPDHLGVAYSTTAYHQANGVA